MTIQDVDILLQKLRNELCIFRANRSHGDKIDEDKAIRDFFFRNTTKQIIIDWFNEHTKLPE